MRSLRSASPTSPGFPASREPGPHPATGARPGSLRAWVMAARVPTLSAAVVPVLVGSGTAVALDRPVHLGAFGAALIASLLIQIGSHLANVLYDVRRGADTEERMGPVRVTHAGLLSPEQVARGMLICFGLAVAVGMYLVWLRGWPILLIGLSAIACGVLYTAGPWPLAYHGLGDVFTFIYFGFVAVVGTHYLHAGALDGLAFAAALPVGMLVTAILTVNNLRDIPTDRETGKRTLAVRLGDRGTRVQYALLVAGAFLISPALYWSYTAGPSVWLPWLTLIFAARLIRTVLGGASGPDLNPVLKDTGRLHLLFGLLFAAGLGWS
ncbi:MAG: 1,4-dihydroxy-2-naphthoate polyprenyltransferase [Firmicutes bacterium]|nr:1,4-dihydroxy-2-naphthoate polyprenyltransferase [Bacillota bacterium]